MHYLLFYDYVPDVLERRPQFRGAHLQHARASLTRGELLLAGAFADNVYAKQLAGLEVEDQLQKS